MSFEKELESLINRRSKENGSGTPDFILAKYLVACLQAFDQGVERRNEWYGRRTDRPTTEEVEVATAVADRSTGVLLNGYIFGRYTLSMGNMKAELQRRGFDPLILYREVEKLIEERTKSIDKGRKG